MQYIIVLESTYLAVGPFKTHDEAAENLTKKGFTEVADYWMRQSADIRETTFAHIRPLRPPSEK